MHLGKRSASDALDGNDNNDDVLESTSGGSSMSDASTTPLTQSSAFGNEAQLQAYAEASGWARVGVKLKKPVS